MEPKPRRPTLSKPESCVPSEGLPIPDSVEFQKAEKRKVRFSEVGVGVAEPLGLVTAGEPESAEALLQLPGPPPVRQRRHHAQALAQHALLDVTQAASLSQWTQEGGWKP